MRLWQHGRAAVDRQLRQKLICAPEAESFEDAIWKAISIGGDSDTIVAIAGSVAESLWGVPEHNQEET